MIYFFQVSQPKFYKYNFRKVKFTRQRAVNAQRGSTDIALLFLTSALDKGWSLTPHLSRFTPRKDPVQDAGCYPAQVWTGAETLVPIRIRSPDCRARSESLYRLRYRGPWILWVCSSNLCNARRTHGSVQRGYSMANLHSNATRSSSFYECLKPNPIPTFFP